jgi:hypothetical protein
MSIDIITDEAFERVKLILHGVPHGAEKALYGIISRATTTIKKVSLDGMTSVYDIKAADIRDRKSTTIKLNTKKTDGGVVGTIHYSGNKIPLYRFGASPKKPTPGATVRARQRRDRPMAVFPNAFIASMRSGHVGIFERTTHRRFPVMERMGAATAHMAETTDVMSKAEEAAYETIVKRTEHEIERILQGYGVR